MSCRCWFTTDEQISFTQINVLAVTSCFLLLHPWRLLLTLCCCCRCHFSGHIHFQSIYTYCNLCAGKWLLLENNTIDIGEVDVGRRSMQVIPPGQVLFFSLSLTFFQSRSSASGCICANYITSLCWLTLARQTIKKKQKKNFELWFSMFSDLCEFKQIFSIVK